MKVIVIGDVSGHHSALEEALGEHADLDTGEVAANTTIIQVGDLIHKGPDSDRLVESVEKFRVNNAAWVQLLGNHEAHHIGGPLFWGISITEDSRRTLLNWWRSGWMRVAASIDTADTDWLCTHAGLTLGWWNRIGAPQQAREAARILNEQTQDLRTGVLEAGLMLGGPARRNAGPVWAESVWELITPWLESGITPPFNQIHGHTSAWNWYKGAAGSKRIADAAVLDTKEHTVTVNVNGRLIVGTDPGNNTTLWRRLGSYELEGDVN